MKNFKKFLEEVTIKGNPGVPDDYLSNAERKAREETGTTGREHPIQIHQTGMEMMELMQTSFRLSVGKEEKLEELAKEIILLNFSELIEGVELDIKLVRPGSREINNLLSDDDQDDEELPSFKKITDQDLKNKIHKAKLGNVIIQGEAKNTKNIIHSEEVKEGLYKIFDRRTTDDLLRNWKRITELAQKMDWMIPIDIKADMMEKAPQGLAGAVKVEWNKKESDDQDSEVGDNSVEDILDKIAKSEELGEEELEFLSDEIDSYDPKIIARAVDFPMLIHETVKGIFELIASISLPGEDADQEEIKQAEIVKYNVSTFLDEAEDFRTGPQIAADFRDFISKNKNIDNHPNLRAYVFGYMMDPAKLSDQDFLKLFKGILDKTQEARLAVDDIIDEIVSELNEYDLETALDGDIDIQDNETEIDAIIRKSEEQPKEVKYSDMSQKEIQNLIDQALDDSDYETVRKLSNYLKEGKLIYLNEIERLLESKINNK
jgi:hypothetical protein